MKSWLSDFVSLFIIGKSEEGETHNWSDMIIYLILLTFIIVMAGIGITAN
ncbi:MAG: hypothetical protein AAF600_19130 [Bacteroidota bacterium]